MKFLLQDPVTPHRGRDVLLERVWLAGWRI